MKKIIDGIEKVQIVAATIFLAIFLVVVIIQMFTRYAGVSALWTQDVSMYSFIWAVFMGAAAMVHEGRHFAFISFQEKLSQKSPALEKGLKIFIDCVMLFFCIMMVYEGYNAAKTFWNYRWETIPSLKRGPVWLCLPICGATSSIYLIYDIVTLIKRPASAVAAKEEEEIKEREGGKN